MLQFVIGIYLKAAAYIQIIYKKLGASYLNISNFFIWGQTTLIH